MDIKKLADEIVNCRSEDGFRHDKSLVAEYTFGNMSRVNAIIDAIEQTEKTFPNGMALGLHSEVINQLWVGIGESLSTSGKIDVLLQGVLPSIFSTSEQLEHFSKTYYYPMNTKAKKGDKVE